MLQYWACSHEALVICGTHSMAVLVQAYYGDVGGSEEVSKASSKLRLWLGG